MPQRYVEGAFSYGVVHAPLSFLAGSDARPYYVAGMRRSAIYLFPLLIGCYAYAPIEPVRVQPGTSVRARVSGARAERIAPLLGTSDARLLSGRLLENRADTMIVEVPTIMQTSVAGSVERLHQRVSIPRADLLELETRRLDRFRTAALAGSVAIIVGAFVINAINGEPGGGGVPGGGGPPESRAPLARLRF
jgi:hypothetical protein